MNPYTPVVLSHANLQRPVRLILGTIAGYHWSDASKATHVYTTGGVFPVSETPEDIDKKLSELTQNKGEIDV